MYEKPHVVNIPSMLVPSTDVPSMQDAEDTIGCGGMNVDGAVLGGRTSETAGRDVSSAGGGSDAARENGRTIRRTQNKSRFIWRSAFRLWFGTIYRAAMG
jgi:hypothetical protein